MWNDATAAPTGSLKVQKAFETYGTCCSSGCPLLELILVAAVPGSSSLYTEHNNVRISHNFVRSTPY